MRNPFNPQYLISHLTNSNGCGNLKTKVLLTVSPFRPSLLPLLRVCFRNRRLVPSSAPRNVNISTILSTLRILPVAAGVYPNPFRLPIPEPSPIPFRINTCKSVSKQTTSTPFRIIHLCKTRRGEGLLLTSHAQFSVSCVLPSQCPLCFCLPRPGRGRKSHVLSSLPPLCRSLRSFSHSVPLFSIACSLFSQNTGGWGTPGGPAQADIVAGRAGEHPPPQRGPRKSERCRSEVKGKMRPSAWARPSSVRIN